MRVGGGGGGGGGGGVSGFTYPGPPGIIAAPCRAPQSKIVLYLSKQWYAV